MPKPLDELPPSADPSWGDGEHYVSPGIKVPLCETHRFRQDGAAAVCEQCPFGTLLAGYMRVYEGSIVDLRRPIGEQTVSVSSIRPHKATLAA